MEQAYLALVDNLSGALAIETMEAFKSGECKGYHIKSRILGLHTSRLAAFIAYVEQCARFNLPV